eukprot:RCo004996
MASAAPPQCLATADLCDKFGDKLRYMEPIFRSYGGRAHFWGQAVTVKCFEDNSFVKSTLDQPGAGKVLVVDAGGSLRRAVLGDMIAAAAVKNQWAGVIIYGCVRDSEEMKGMPLGVKALNTHPRKTDKKNIGEKDLEVSFAGVVIRPNDWVVADSDGVVVADFALY